MSWEILHEIAKSCNIAGEFAVEVPIPVRPYRIVVVSHGELAAALCATAQLICGPLDAVVPIGLDASAPPEELALELRAALDGPDVAELPVLVLADLAGGTPFNIASLVARQVPNVVVLGGVNLGMLIEAITSVDPLEQVVPHLVEAGRAGIREAAPLRLRRVV